MGGPIDNSWPAATTAGAPATTAGAVGRTAGAPATTAGAVGRTAGAPATTAGAPRRTGRLRSDAVHERLRRAILDGSLPPGAAIPSERVLSEEMDVNRHAVREAVKRLQQAGLVQVSQGGATRVLDWRAHGGLDLLADLAGSDAGALGDLLRSVFEMRATIGADAARLCARRAGADLRAEIASLGGAVGGDLEAYERLWQRIVEGSGNVAYRLAFNSLVAARHPAGGVPPAAYGAELGDPAAIAALAAAIAQGDHELADRRARDLLERAR